MDKYCRLNSNSLCKSLFLTVKVVIRMLESERAFSGYPLTNKSNPLMTDQVALSNGFVQLVRPCW